MVSGEPDGTLRINAVVQYTAAEMHALMHGSVGTVDLEDEGTESQHAEYEAVGTYGLSVVSDTSPTPETGSKVVIFTIGGYIE